MWEIYSLLPSPVTTQAHEGIETLGSNTSSARYIVTTQAYEGIETEEVAIKMFGRKK